MTAVNFAAGPLVNSDQKSQPMAEPSKSSSASAAEASTEQLQIPISIRASLLILAGLALAFAAYSARSILFPITLAILLNLVLKPVILFMRRWHILEPIGAAAVILVCLGIFSAIVLPLVEPASSWLSTERINDVQSKLFELRHSVEEFSEAAKTVDELATIDDLETPTVEIKQPSLTTAVFSSTGNAILGGFVTLVMLYFLLAAGDRPLEKVVELMPTFKDKRQIVELARDVQSGVSRYLFSITAINIGLGVCIGVAMHLLKLPTPTLWGVMAALLNFVPFAGAAVGAIIVFLVGLLELDTAWQALGPPIAYIVINSIEANFVTPLVLGRSVSLSPVIIFASLIFWSWIWGMGGALVAVPLLAVTKLACDHFPPLHPVGKLLAR